MMFLAISAVGLLGLVLSPSDTLRELVFSTVTIAPVIALIVHALAVL